MTYDWNWALAEARRMIEGDSRTIALVPQRLIDLLPTIEGGIATRETAIVIYCLIDEWQSLNDGQPVQINNKAIFKKVAGSDTVDTAKDWLKRNGFIKVGPFYKNDVSSKRHQILDRDQIVEFTLRRKKLFEMPPNDTGEKYADVASRITRRNLNKLTVDTELAVILLAHRLLEDTQGDVVLSLKDKKRAEKQDSRTPADREASIVAPLRNLIRKTGGIIRADNGNRLFSPLTQLWREFRPCLSYHGESLVGIDMSACQPTLIAKMAKDERLLADCYAGVFYNKIEKYLGISRDAAKQWFCAWTFGGNRSPTAKARKGSSTYEAQQIQRFMDENYPVTAAYVRKEKTDERENPHWAHYKKFSHRLQRQESDLFVNTILLELDKRGIFALSLHDSIVTPESKAEQVRQIIEEIMEIRRIKGRLKTELMTNKKAHQQDNGFMFPVLPSVPLRDRDEFITGAHQVSIAAARAKKTKANSPAFVFS